jgi:1-aminocyclopropane-1-carboxylate deaminase/D-cysteine desulfhydrase-like pyridoxal-dependent ACC family enzyme
MSRRADLQASLDALPRVSLAHLPTPLERAPRLSKALGGAEVWIKRDDLTGLCFDGNKTRQLEFVFAEMLRQGCDTLVAGAYSQSNWCRQMTAAARKLGVEVALVLLHGEKGPVLQGNFLLDKLMGADVRVVDLASMELLQPLLDARAEEARDAGRRPFVVAPMGLENLALGAVGYVQAAVELDAQLEAQHVAAEWLVVSGANMTPGRPGPGLPGPGPADQAHQHGADQVDDGPGHRHRPDRQRHGRAAGHRRSPGARGHREPRRVHRRALRRGHGRLPGGAEAGRRHRGPDPRPRYSGKAIAGLIDLARTGRFHGGQVVYIHTGGTPALFAYADDLGLSP